MDTQRDDFGEAASICMDCAYHDAEPIPEPVPQGYFCPHWRPQYWIKRGFNQYWGDAAVNNWPHMEILRKETDEGAEFVILAPFVLRRPVTITTDDPDAWGGY